MLNLVLAASLAFTAQVAEPPALTLQQQTSLRCAAAFALVHRDRNAGTASYPDYPDMEVRGKEFFVRAGAQLIDETGIDRVQFESMILAEMEALSGEQRLAEIMPGCLLLLDASGI